MVEGPGGVAVIVSQWLLTTIAAVIIGARLWLRIMIQRRHLWVSDVLMILALLASVSLSCMDIVSFRLGALEPHVDYNLLQYDGTPDQVVLILKMFWIGTIPFYLTFYLCKAALLATFLQIFPRFMKRRRYILLGTIVFTALCFIASVCFHIFGCQPVQRNWSIDPAEACPSAFAGTSFRLGWSLHFISDLAIFALPWLILHELQLKPTVKIGVYCTFLLGVINIGCSIARFATLQSADQEHAVPLSLLDLWSSLDCNMALVIACLPSLRPYFRSRKTLMEPSDAYYPAKYGGNSIRKSAPGLSQRGFKPIDEPLSPAMPPPRGDGPNSTIMGVVRTTTIHVQTGPSTRSGSTVEEVWERDPREKSDIELVEVKRVGGGRTGV